MKKGSKEVVVFNSAKFRTETITGDTRVSNSGGGLVSKLDREYGTEYQEILSVKKAKV